LSQGKAEVRNLIAEVKREFPVLREGSSVAKKLFTTEGTGDTENTGFRAFQCFSVPL
jgi:hypothetical protein